MAKQHGWKYGVPTAAQEAANKKKLAAILAFLNKAAREELK